MEARGAGHRGARPERGEERGDEAVDVEQRHHVQAAVRGRQAERQRDVRRARGQLPVRERHELRPRRGSRRVQQERDGIGIGPVVDPHTREDSIDSEHARRSGRVGGQLENADAELPGHFAGGRVESCVDHDRVRSDVLEVEGELLRAVRGIERRHGGGLRQREERAGGLRPVPDQEGDPAPFSEPARSQPAGDSADQLSELAVRQGQTARRADGVRPGLERLRTLEEVPDPIHSPSVRSEGRRVNRLPAGRAQ